MEYVEILDISVSVCRADFYREFIEVTQKWRSSEAFECSVAPSCCTDRPLRVFLTEIGHNLPGSIILGLVR